MSKDLIKHITHYYTSCKRLAPAKFGPVQYCFEDRYETYDAGYQYKHVASLRVNYEYYLDAFKAQPDDKQRASRSILNFLYRDVIYDLCTLRDMLYSEGLGRSDAYNKVVQMIDELEGKNV